MAEETSPREHLTGGSSHNDSVAATDIQPILNPKPFHTTASMRSYCCITKAYYSEYANLIDSLHIIPRLMLQKTSFRVGCTYGLSLIVRNNGLYPRLLKFSSDSPNDTTINSPDLEKCPFIETDQTITVKISIRSSTSNNINRRRHIFIHSYHPNITFQVPVIVAKDLMEPSVCEHVYLPSCVPKDRTYYELLVYNPTKDPIKVKYRSSFKGFTLNHSGKDFLPALDYAKVLLTFEPQKLQEYRGFFNMKFGMSPPKLVVFEFTPKSMSAFVSRGYISFGNVKFGESESRSIIVCNDSPHPVTVSGTFDSNDSQNRDSVSGSYTDKRISERAFEDAVSMHSVMMFDLLSEGKSKNSNSINSFNAASHFVLEKIPESLAPYTSYEIVLQFKPNYERSCPFPDDTIPPYYQRTNIVFCFTDVHECIESYSVAADGKIKGVAVEIYPKAIDLRKIYLGEEHCAFIKILNVDGIDAKVKYKDCLEPDTCGVCITPTDGFLLEPCERGIFHMSFFTITPSRFAVTLRFKVENGLYYNVIVKGIGTYAQLRTFPQLVEFGTIPFGVPQKRFMLLMNPLAVPITLQVQATEDGEEAPLVLNIRDSTELLPITVKDPIKQLQRAHEDLRNEVDLVDNTKLTTDQPDMMSERSFSINESVYSSEFEEEVMEPVPVMASNLLKNLKKQKIFDKSETDKRVIQEALQELLDTNYFSIFNKHNNFIFMDWNAIPSDPKEVYCDNEIIYLRPNTGRSITILIIPNRLGYFHRSLSVRICPALSQAASETSEEHHLKTLIKSEYLCSKLWYEYNCCTPEIEWDSFVDLAGRMIYAGEEYGFDMIFHNPSTVGGFLHFDVIPNEMSFRDGNWKFYIGASCDAVAKCLIIFRVLSSNKLSGLIKIVGDPHPYPFHVFANVLPTEIRITPNVVRQRMHVFELNKVHFYIDNYTPTNTKLTIKLRDVQHQHLTTRGGILAPTGQSMYTTLVSMFTDPDLYQNIMYIDLQFAHVMEIPLYFLVEGVPLYFEPNIKEGFDAGLLFTDTKENFIANTFIHRFPVKVINKGHRTYRVNITRLSTINPAIKISVCSQQPLTARFEIVPKLLELAPNSEEYLEILISGYEEGMFYCDFLMDIKDTKYPQRKHVIKITIKAVFGECQLGWNRKELPFHYQPSDPLKERAHVETAELINLNSLTVENVLLDVTGPFRIKEMYEHHFEKQINVRLNPYERKEIFVLLNKATIKQLYCRQVEGRINITALNKMHKPLLVRLSVEIPQLHIFYPELVLFDRGFPFDSCVNIINHGCAQATYKWRRLEVAEEIIGEDEPLDVVEEILAQILRTLEYNFTCEEEPNLTLRYQQCRCQFKKDTENGYIMWDIIEEIINKLDLSKRRFLIRMDDDKALLDDSDVHSSSSFIRHTLEDILGKLNIESSQQLSTASSEYCFSDSFIYFYEKTGLLNKLQTQECVLHLPHIRRSHEVRSVFQLCVVGGISQTLSVTLVNVAQKIKFHKDNIYLNIKPWYESYSTNFRITNVTKYPLYLRILPISPEQSKEKQLIDGYAKLMQSDQMFLPPLGADKVKFNGILGFSETFLRNFCVLINDTATSQFRLRGQGVMPILNIISPMPMIEQSMSDVLEEYALMRTVYNYEMFKSITELDAEPRGPGEEEGVVESDVTADFSELSSSDEGMSDERQRAHDYQLFQMVHSYVYVNNNQEVPNPVVLNQMLVTERYLNRLRLNPELYKTHQKVYQEYLNLHTTLSYKQASNVKHFTVQPLPCEQLAYVLDLGPLTRNTLRRFEIRLHFFGPGKLIAAVRTAVRIPGLYLDFTVDNHPDKKFTYWAEQCAAPELIQKKYRNMWERLLDADTNPKLKHAHSFDFDKFINHQREVADKDRRLIEHYYNSLNKSVYPDHKHHLMLAKIFTTHHSNFSGVDLRIVGLFKPESKYYERNQRIVDYIYVDLHMGPTLPILLRGVISA